MDNTNISVLNRFYEQVRSTGIDIRLEEFCELTVFSEFLEGHVQPDGIGSVQCMLLWNEWVRTYRRYTHKLPKLILEKECRYIMTDKFGVEIADGGSRGAIYPGIRFVP